MWIFWDHSSSISSSYLLVVLCSAAADVDSVELRDCDNDSVLELLRFRYSDEVKLNVRNVMRVSVLANRFLSPSLADNSNRFITDNLDASNVSNTLPLAWNKRRRTRSSVAGKWLIGWECPMHCSIPESCYDLRGCYSQAPKNCPLHLFQELRSNWYFHCQTNINLAGRYHSKLTKQINFSFTHSFTAKFSVIHLAGPHSFLNYPDFFLPKKVKADINPHTQARRHYLSWIYTVQQRLFFKIFEHVVFYSSL